jgi:predicted transcriptional regulator
MTIAKQHRSQSQLPKRLQQIDDELRHLVLSARQLQLTEAEVVKALRAKWEKSDE